MSKSIWAGTDTPRDVTAFAAEGRELIRQHAGADLVLSEIGELYEMIADDPHNGWFDALGAAYDMGVATGARIADK